jgi:hypothetical protein
MMTDYRGLGTLTASTANGDSGLQRNPGVPGIHVVVDITTIAAGSLTVTIEGYDSASGKYDMLPHFWRVKWVVATGPVTATIAASVGG